MDGPNNRILPIFADVVANAIPLQEGVYLGVNRRNIEKCKEDLSILSTTDAKHDFSGKSSQEYIINAVKRFIPHWMISRTYPSLSEETAFKLVVGEEIEQVFRRVLTNNNVAQLNLVNPIRNYLTYGVSRASLQSGADLQNFLQRTTGAQNHIFSIDFDNQHLLELAKIGAPVPNANIFVVNSRETIADPAPKTIVDLKKNIKKYMGNTGIKLTQLHDSDPNNVNYTMFDDYQLDILNDFYSSLNIELSPIDRRTNNTKLIITSSDDGYSKVILNPKKEGSIASGVEKLVKFFSKKNEFDDQVQIVQKRAGDWLQALSCLQNMRSYEPLLPPEAPYILVTHDRVLLSYALYIGVNVIFLKQENRSENMPQSIILFYNNIEQKKISFKTSLEKFWNINGPQRLEFAFELRGRLIAEAISKNDQDSLFLNTFLNAMVQAKAENKPRRFNTKCTDYIETLLRIIIRKEKMESLYKTQATIRQEDTAAIIAQFSNITDENEQYLKQVQNFITICEENITKYGNNINKAIINAAIITDITMGLEKRVRLESPQYLKKNNCKDVEFSGGNPNHKPYINALLKFLQDNEPEATANLLQILNNNIQLGGYGEAEAGALIADLEHQNRTPENYINYNYFSFADTEEDPTISEIFINLYEYQFQAVQKLLSVRGANVQLTYRFMGIVINDIIVEDDDLQYKNAVIYEFANIAPQNWIRYFSDKNNNSNPSRIHQLCMDCIEHFYTFKYLNNYNVPRSIFNTTQKIKKVNPKKLPNATNYMKDRRTRAINTVGRRRNAAKLTRRQLYQLQPQQPQPQQPQYQEIIPEGGRRTNKLKKTRRRQQS
jgi:hypothetical protein